MADSQLPHAAAEIVTDRRTASVVFHRWMSKVERIVAGLGATVSEVAAAQADASPLSITGINGVTVSGSEEAGFVVSGSGAASSTASGVPLSIGEDEIFTVAANTQVLYSLPITVDGQMVIDGYLVEV